ncbi:MAG: GNAT family N-acetyltransferase [Dehalococcoidales bacterium]
MTDKIVGHMMNNSEEDIIRLNRSHVRRANRALIKAFWNHPPLQYYFPDEAERERIAPYFFSLSVFYGTRYGEVHATSQDLEGIAVWLPSNNYPITPWKLLRSVPPSAILGFGIYKGSRMRGLDQHIDAMHSRLAPFKHWFLQSIGVAPQFQGRGYASKLLRPMLSRIDEEGLPCYLETLEVQNVRLYEHFGFKVIEESNVPDTNLTNWAMLREAR